MLAAVQEGDVRKLAELMRQDPGFDVNMNQSDRIGFTLLFYACCKSESSPVIPLLLAHPDIDVNVKGETGWTPFFSACGGGRSSCVRELLKDSRVKVNEPNNSGLTPLWWSACGNYLGVIKWWIVSGREMDLVTPGNDRTDAIGIAKKLDRTKVVTLLEKFKENPNKTRHGVRVEVGWYEKLAAEMFALVVFVSDGLLQVNDATTPSPAARFFSVAAQLPLELQMVLCFHQVGSGKEIIPGKDSEVAFKELAKRLQWSSFFAVSKKDSFLGD